MVTSEFDKIKMFGGLGNYVNELVEELTNQGHECIILVNKYYDHRINKTKVKKTNGYNIIETSFLPVIHKEAEKNIENINNKIDEIYEIIKKLNFKIDVIHNNNFLNFLLSDKLKTKLNAPIVTTIHSYALNYIVGNHNNAKQIILGLENIFNKKKTLSRNHSFINPEKYNIEISYWLEKRMFRKSDFIIFPSYSMKKLYNYYYDSFSIDYKSKVVYNGTNLELYKSDNFKSINHFKELKKGNNKIIIYAGRLAEQKGVEFLIRAFKQVYKKQKNVYLVIAGNGKLLENLISLTYKEKLSHRVVFTGFIPKEELIQLYKVSDIGVIPSLWEPFGYVAIEMMACGLPIIVSDIEGLAEIVEDNYSGLNVALKNYNYDDYYSSEVDVKELSYKILKLLNDEKLRDHLIENALKTVNEKFDIKNMTKEINNVFKNMTEKILI